MRAIIQRVSSARVRVGDETVGAIGRGFLVLLGVAESDGESQVRALAGKIPHLRIFPNEAGKFDRSLLDVGGQALIVSQFTLLGETRKGRRPSFTRAAPPERAEALYEQFVTALQDEGVTTATGRFGAMMAVELVNDGPVTLILDTQEWDR